MWLDADTSYKEGMNNKQNVNIAILIPCFNEKETIGKVIKDFKQELPSAKIYVYDNNSTDGTDGIAEEAGAIVRYEYRQGKGNVIKSMFQEVNSDIYVLIDGDDTYPVEKVKEMISLVINERADMVIGDRLTNGAYRKGRVRRYHNWGNGIVKTTINYLFKSNIADVMTGYRVMNKRFVKNFPILSQGFEIETEMTIHALDKKYRVREVQIDYRDRPVGSTSKLNTIRDGIKVLITIISIFKDYRPLSFFGMISTILFFIGIGCGVPVVYEFAMDHYIRHIPLAILASAIEILALLFLVCGFILDTIAKFEKRNYELQVLKYMTIQQERGECDGRMEQVG